MHHLATKCGSQFQQHLPYYYNCHIWQPRMKQSLFVMIYSPLQPCFYSNRWVINSIYWQEVTYNPAFRAIIIYSALITFLYYISVTMLVVSCCYGPIEPIRLRILQINHGNQGFMAINNPALSSGFALGLGQFMDRKLPGYCGLSIT